MHEVRVISDALGGYVGHPLRRLQRICSWDGQAQPHNTCFKSSLDAACSFEAVD